MSELLSRASLLNMSLVPVGAALRQYFLRTVLFFTAVFLSVLALVMMMCCSNGM
jgi:hypothetical protein